MRSAQMQTGDLSADSNTMSAYPWIGALATDHVTTAGLRFGDDPARKD
ncbi:MAG: hypothetical protein AAGA56_10650 [Myxococcota bacterium]